MEDEKREENGVQYVVHESIPLQDVQGTDGSNKEPWNPEPANTVTSFVPDVRYDKVTRHKIVESICISLAFMILGWTKGQLGPAFLDLLFISGTDLEKGSGFMTSYFTGRMLGSILAGAIFKKVNKYLLFVISIPVNGVAVAVIPWCFRYELMVAAHVLHGISGGVLDVAVTSAAVSIWGPTKRGRSYLQILNASFAASSLLSPMATAPFLIPSSAEVSTDGSSWNASVAIIPALGNQTTESPSIYDLIYNDTRSQTLNSTVLVKQTSQLYIAYSMSAGLAFLAAIPLAVLFVKSGPSGTQRHRNVKFEFIGNSPILMKRLQLINLGVFSAVHTAVDYIFGGYLSVFCVQYLGWTKTSAAILTSVSFFASLVGRFVGLFLVQVFQSHIVLLLGTIGYFIGFVGISVSAHAYYDIGIWISVCVIGIPFGVMWPTFLSWTVENLVPISGKIAAYLLVSAFSGALLSPILIGYLMEEISLLWFCYLLDIKSFFTIISVLLMIFHTKYTAKFDNDKDDSEAVNWNK